MRAIVTLATAVVVIAGSTSCTLEPPVAPAQDIENTTFATTLGVDLTKMTKTASGMYFLDVTPGAGATAATGNHVTVHYTGFLTNATIFDTSIGKSPFGFTIGAEQVIKGWDEGMVGVRIGGTRRLVIPPTLAYGAGSIGLIPPNAILVFNVQLLSIP